MLTTNSTFDAKIPAALQKARYKRGDLIDQINRGQHLCDCEFCDVEGDLTDWEVEELQKELAELEADIGRMERYAKAQGLPDLK